MSLFLRNTLAVFCAAMIVISFSACGSAGNQLPASGSSQSSVYNASEETPADNLSTVTAADFADIAGQYGQVQDETEAFGFDARAVNSDDGLNYIYLNMQSDAAAKSMIFGNGDSMDDDVTIAKAGGNYDYYEEYSKCSDSASSDCTPFYGYYLRVDSMVILITGPYDDADNVRTRALSFLSELGYK